MAKGGGKPQNEDWACCEQCSFCFTIFVGVLFFLAGGAMAVYAALFLWSDFDVSIPGLELLDVDGIQIGIFVVGLCIAGAALLGMISAGCAKCAANPDGKHDCCEQCCTPILSTLYIIILSVLLAATLAIAGVLSYYAAVVGSSTATECPYPSGSSNRQFVSGNPPDAAACPIDYLLYEVFFGAGATAQETGNATWIAGQDAAYLCGFYCNGNAPPFGNPDWCPKAGSDSDYDIQTTGTYCSNLIPAGATVPSYTVFQGKTGSNGLGLQDNSISTFQEGTALITTEYVSMPYRPTFYSVLDSILIPALVVWWLIFVFAILLIVAACAMCILKKKTTKDSTYKPSSNV